VNVARTCSADLYDIYREFSERASTLKELRAPDENMGLRVAYSVLVAGFLFYGM